MRKLVIILSVFALFATDTFGQRVVRGKVVDDLGEPLIGATIMVKGTIKNYKSKIINNNGTFKQYLWNVWL
jgi:hypothetical protein